MTVVYSEQFLNLHVDFGLDFVHVCLFRV